MNSYYDLTRMMILTIAMGIVMVWIFSKLAKRDSEGWDKSYESKGMKTIRIGLMFIWGLIAIVSLLGLIVQWYNIPDRQKVSFTSIFMWCLSLFYYELTMRQSPRGGWVKTRKIIAYMLIIFLYIGVWQYTAYLIAHFPFNWISVQFFTSILITGICITGIWLLLKIYKKDKYIPYTKHEEPSVTHTNLDADKTNRDTEDYTRFMPKQDVETIEEVSSNNINDESIDHTTDNMEVNNEGSSNESVKNDEEENRTAP